MVTTVKSRRIFEPPDFARARTTVDRRVRGSMKPFSGGGGNTRNNSLKLKIGERNAKILSAEAVGDFSWPGTQWRYSATRAPRSWCSTSALNDALVARATLMLRFRPRQIFRAL